MTEEQLNALNAINQGVSVSDAPGQIQDFNPEQLYKLIGGDWGNSYGYIENLEADEATVLLVGQGVSVSHAFESMQAVPFYGA